MSGSGNYFVRLRISAYSPFVNYLVFNDALYVPPRSSLAIEVLV